MESKGSGGSDGPTRPRSDPSSLLAFIEGIRPWYASLMVGVITAAGVAGVDWDLSSFGSPLLHAAGAAGLAYLMLRWGNRRTRHVVAGYLTAGFVGFCLAGALLMHPYWSVDEWPVDEARPQDVILGYVIFGSAAIGALTGAIVGGRAVEERDSD